MTFLSPLLLLALIPVAALALAYVWTARRRRRYAVRFAALPMLERVMPRQPGWRRHLAAGLVLAALVGIALAAARPHLDLRVPYERATVIVAIDTSLSMEADDVTPTRLEAAKDAAESFVAQLPDTFNVGVVHFAGTASVVVPATTDHDEVQRRIGALSLGSGGTAIGESVFQALSEIERVVAAGEAEQREEGAETAVPARLVLLSDGESTTGRSPDAAADAAASAGVPVSTIAYGTPDGRAMVEGRQTTVPVDAETLRAMAERTDGGFYEAENRAELRRVYDDIGSSIGWRVEPTDIAPFLALFGVLTTVVAGALSLRWFSRLI